jgi:glycosyltransferase involved in cell wall biosynthesis
VRVCLFTDTLGDVNGVSRFIRDVAEQASATGRDLRVLSSTRFAVPARENLINFRPRAAGQMPGYEGLELAWPPARAMLRYVLTMRPDAVHISTPGPVGCVGRYAAGRLGVPVLGVYHTDFPAYVRRLFEDELMPRATARFMRWFYCGYGGGFARVFTRSAEYEEALVRLGVARERIVRLRPGINTDSFSTEYQDAGVWERAGVSRRGVKVLYCGRISVEKNLPLLCEVWKRVEARLAEDEAQLVVVGGGPYRERMERELPRARFLGFRHGAELSALYASADVFVFPSITDTLGQVVMEAQASGLPVLVSDRGGPREVVRDGVTGCVLPAGDADAWCGAIVGLVRDHARRKRMGEAAAEFIRPMTIRASFEEWWRVHEHAAAHL